MRLRSSRNHVLALQVWAQAEAAVMPMHLHQALAPVSSAPGLLLGPVWARRRPVAKPAQTGTRAETPTDEQPYLLPSSETPPLTDEHPNLPLSRYRRQPHFHQVNLSFPGLQLVHEEPYIFLVHGFLSAAECDVLIRKSSASSSSDGAASERGRTRTSCSSIMQNNECAGLRAKLARLANVSVEQLQPSKLTRYDRGALFSKHTDAYLPNRLGVAVASVAAEPARFPNRFCTVFIYLNDVARGGCTRWGWLDENPCFYAHELGTAAGRDPYTPPDGPRPSELRIRPRRGMAVLHFPCSLAGVVDPNAQHESEAAVDPKYICQQFIWAARPASDEVEESVRLYWQSFESDQPETPLSAEAA